jgi:hypothetical protein
MSSRGWIPSVGQGACLPHRPVRASIHAFFSRSAYHALVGSAIIAAKRPIVLAIGFGWTWLSCHLSGRMANRRVAGVRSAAAGKPADCDVGYAQRVSSNHFGSRSSAS